MALDSSCVPATVTRAWLAALAALAISCSRPITNPFSVIDTDLDGVVDIDDNCFRPNPDQVDTDDDGIGDVCDPDFDLDADTVNNAEDNCLSLPNETQVDGDQDGLGDLCDADDDGDRFTDAEEALAGSDPRNGSSTPNACATDADCAQYDTADFAFRCDPLAQLCFVVNTPPIADAGSRQVAEPGDIVQLDAGMSRDPEGRPLSFSWAVRGDTWGIVLPDVVSPTFVVPDGDGAVVSIVIDLTVDDGSLTSPATVEIQVNRAPVVEAGPDRTVGRGQLITLDGSASYDPDHDSHLTYAWECVRCEAVTLLQANQAVAQLVTPSLSTGILELRLTVDDGIQRTDAQGTDIGPGRDEDSVLIVVANDAPVAMPVLRPATGPRTPTREIDGTGSYDPDGDALTYQWTVVRRADGVSLPLLPGPDEPSISFQAAELGIYDVVLTVNDGLLASLAEAIEVVVENQPPAAAIALASASPNLGDLVELDGAGSSDADGDMVTFAWRLIAKPAGSVLTVDPFLPSSSAAAPTFSPDREGLYTVGLVVDEGFAASVEATRVVPVGADPVAIVAVSGDGQAVWPGDPFAPLVARAFDQTTDVQVALIPSAAFARAYEAKASAYRAVAWTALGLAAAAAGAAIGLRYAADQEASALSQDVSLVLAGTAVSALPDAAAFDRRKGATDLLDNIALTCAITAVVSGLTSGDLFLAGDEPGRYRAFVGEQ